jgi:murein DD-endopeptidase MepM/ murein hydrolase activator NlpD
VTSTSRRAVLAGLGVSLPAASALAATPPLKLSGRYEQGGFAIGATTPHAKISVDGAAVGSASAHGLFVVGFDRDAASAAKISARTDKGVAEEAIFVAPGDFDVQKIDGLPQDQVTPEAPELLERIAREAERKAVGFASNVDADDFRSGFIMPLNATRVSGRFGGQRILNGVPNRPHYGADLAAPIGTPVHAPAAGTVCFAETGLHFEGGLIMIDHGQGLVSMYLHLSKVGVQKGDRLTQGQQIGAVGAEGRATGPHLCWRMKWRGRNLDPTLMVGAKPPLVG